MTVREAEVQVKERYLPASWLTEDFGNKNSLVQTAGERSPINITHLHSKQENMGAIKVFLCKRNKLYAFNYQGRGGGHNADVNICANK